MRLKGKFLRFLALQINGLFPFIYQHVFIFKNANFIKGVVLYHRDRKKYIEETVDTSSRFPLHIKNLYPIYYDRFERAGAIPRHYFLQDIWAARKVLRKKVFRHYDIGSRLDGFISHCLVFCRVTMLDIRPLSKKIENLSFIECDCTNMNQIRDNSIRSLSSLHAIEHFGLGRYGDMVDPDGYIKVINEIQRVVKKNGDIYISLPIGNQRLEFNAHRVFDPKYVIRLFDNCTLVEFSVIDDNNDYFEKVDYQNYRKCIFACGLFHFKKK